VLLTMCLTGDEPGVLELSSCFAFDEVEPE